jgi:hypothetical protein
MRRAGEELYDDLSTEVPKPRATSPHVSAPAADRENRGAVLWRVQV